MPFERASCALAVDLGCSKSLSMTIDRGGHMHPWSAIGSAVLQGARLDRFQKERSACISKRFWLCMYEYMCACVLVRRAFEVISLTIALKSLNLLHISVKEFACNRLAICHSSENSTRL